MVLHFWGVFLTSFRFEIVEPVIIDVLICRHGIKWVTTGLQLLYSLSSDHIQIDLLPENFIAKLCCGTTSVFRVNTHLFRNVSGSGVNQLDSCFRFRALLISFSLQVRER